MPIQLEWTDDFARIALTRARCYGTRADEVPRFEQLIHDDPRAVSGDYLIARDGDEDLGTTTSLSMTMWIRGAPKSCHGVAWVGTIRTARRRPGAGVAHQLMHASLNRAREREQIVSALMPFRPTFYSRFGYGIVERRNEWSIPLSLIPNGTFDSMHYFKPTDANAIAALRQRQVQAGQCDIETTADAWTARHKSAETGFQIVDLDENNSARGWMFLTEHEVLGQRSLRVTEHAADSIDAFKRQLNFLASQKDQYVFVTLFLPTDFPLNFLLTEAQLPHRPVPHRSAAMTTQTRMQVRILDHIKFCEGLKLQSAVRGSVVVAVKECEESVSKFKIEFDAGSCSAMHTEASADIECRDVEWAMIACGTISATVASNLGLITANNPRVLQTLDAFSIGPTPFCNEYF